MVLSMVARRRSARIITVYVLSLVVALALLVYWIIFVVQSYLAINEYAARMGGAGSSYHWVALAIGCALFVVLIAGLTFQLAQALGERNYSRRQEEFVSNITHEMKSPLAAIKLHAQTLEDEDLGPEERARSVRYVLQQVGRMETLVDNVLESSRLMARRRPHPPGPIALRPFFDAYFREVAPSAEQRGIRLVTRVETDATVLGHADGLHRIMTNLVENAIRFSQRNGEVRCAVVDQGRQVIITVEDDGIGIPPTELTKVFDRFYQIGRELSERRGGTGLGLSIVYGLAREMRGRVRARSHDGRRGTTFEVTLPMAEDPR
jgi:signal transduction histidine kinase